MSNLPKPNENRIFVTGVPRSGTTFVSTILSLPLQVNYINEPFNTGNDMPHRYRYVRYEEGARKTQPYFETIQRILNYDVKLKTSFHSSDPWYLKFAKSIVGGRGAAYLRLAKLNPFHTATIIKDPTAGLLAEYLFKEFSIKPVIIVRHPVSLAASLKRVNWQPSLHWLRKQEQLIEDYFPEERDFLQREYASVALAGAAHWRAIYKVLLAQARTYRSWQVVLLEEVSQAPVASFERLYRALDLPWSKSVIRKIRKLTRDGSAEARGGRVHDLRRNSAAIFEQHRSSLSLEERKAIFDIVEDVALPMYSRESFQIDQNNVYT